MKTNITAITEYNFVWGEGTLGGTQRAVDFMFKLVKYILKYSAI